MNLTNYDEVLEDYLQAIELSATQSDRVESALKRLSGVMLTAYNDAEIYAQGSYATDTLVKPLTDAQSDGNAGEFDVDIVVEREAWDGAEASLDSIAETLATDAKYANMPIDNTKQKCVRIDYATDSSGVGFHVDVVPTRVTDTGREVPVRKDDDWTDSDAKTFADWFNGRCDEQPSLRKIAMILKRLRDRADQTDNLKSITTLTLTEKHYVSTGSLMGDLVATLDGINSHVSKDDWTLPNPINEGEDLNVTVKDAGALKAFFDETTISIDDALDNDGEGLEEVFGTGYTAPQVEKAASSLAAATPLAATTRAYAREG